MSGQRNPKDPNHRPSAHPSYDEQNSSSHSIISQREFDGHHGRNQYVRSSAYRIDSRYENSRRPSAEYNDRQTSSRRYYAEYDHHAPRYPRDSYRSSREYYDRRRDTDYYRRSGDTRYESRDSRTSNREYGSRDERNMHTNSSNAYRKVRSRSPSTDTSDHKRYRRESEDIPASVSRSSSRRRDPYENTRYEQDIYYKVKSETFDDRSSSSGSQYYSQKMDYLDANADLKYKHSSKVYNDPAIAKASTITDNFGNQKNSSQDRLSWHDQPDPRDKFQLKWAQEYMDKIKSLSKQTDKIRLEENETSRKLLQASFTAERAKFEVSARESMAMMFENQVLGLI